MRKTRLDCNRRWDFQPTLPSSLSSAVDESMLVLSQKRRRCHLLINCVDEKHCLVPGRILLFQWRVRFSFFVIFKQEFKVLQLLSFEVANLFIPFVGSRLPFLDPVDRFFPLAQLINDFWLVAWNIVFPFSWECHHPNQLTKSIIFQRGRLNHQTVFHDVQELAMQLSESRGTLQAGRKLICNFFAKCHEVMWLRTIGVP